MEEKKLGGKKMQGTRSLLASLQPIMTGIRGAVGYISRLFGYTDTDTSSLYCICNNITIQVNLHDVYVLTYS